MTLRPVPEQLRSRAQSAKTSLGAKRHTDGWVLPEQSTSFALEGTWTNVDLDVTPLISDIVSSSCFMIALPGVISASAWKPLYVDFSSWQTRRVSLHIDVAALYRPEGSIGPAMPGLAHKIAPSLDIGGAQYVSDLSLPQSTLQSLNHGRPPKVLWTSIYCQRIRTCMRRWSSRSSLRKHEVKETEFEQGPSMEVRILAVQRVPTVHKLLYADSMYVCAPRPRLQRLRVAQTLNLVGPVEHKVSRSNTCAQRH
ncbi:hypothetical protein AUEXF2481DRAFT_88071 [Aureobasidium subglaciale EXF-2481]|uniref:Uncharacterized protein n=1 Tax=Aureobasidium subglaciale (strain EXF-2481) TaxID=1043005 RepID=A0A074YP99_AURSE|nr:uncharacterized protein AUEXF2481DRAFT_88071 [Aureobasidium subglaciale EXF-2481]KEQ95912.1 hypothetical protein AUEXF2481DRAFT_88071 [Aureobasidium subglaciale EXF-2481]